jgi:hypothetical protein
MANSIIKPIISYVIIASVFITGPTIGQFSFSLYWYFPFYLFFIGYALFSYKKISLPIFTALTLITLYALITHKSDLNLVFKQLTNIIASALVFYLLFVHENYSIEKLMRKYVTFAKILLIIGLVQVLLFILGLERIFLFIFPFLKTTNITFRFQSLSEEPSFIAVTFAPLVFLSLNNLFNRRRYLFNKTWSRLFIFGYLLTFASSAYIALLFMLLFLYFKRVTAKKFLFAGVALGAIFLFGYTAYHLVPIIKLRVDDTAYGLTGNFDNPEVYRSVNLSTYALLSNWYVTKKGLSEFPLTGRGLGTHETTYDQHLPQKMKDYVVLNNKDANSMAMRLLTETGIIGFLLFLSFAVKYRIHARSYFTESQDFAWIINTGILVVIIISLLRNGNYTSNGKLLFFILYYYSNRFVYNQKRKGFDETQQLK